jgi:hypothetical protein
MEAAKDSAAVVAPLLYELLRPESLIDVGCGAGAWAAAFSGLGAEVMGIDDGIDESRLLIPADRFVPHDLTTPVALRGGFDVALCLEVGEHLPERAAAILVASLTGLAPVVAFSAAIPGQRGIDHVNEQWPAYWEHLFATHGYRPLDLVRPRIWRDERVEPWYRQNLLVYASPDAYPELERLAVPYGAAEPLVHPAIFEAQQVLHRLEVQQALHRRDTELTLRKIARALPGAARAAAAHRLARRR